LLSTFDECLKGLTRTFMFKRATDLRENNPQNEDIKKFTRMFNCHSKLPIS